MNKVKTIVVAPKPIIACCGVNGFSTSKIKNNATATASKNNTVKNVFARCFNLVSSFRKN